MQTPLEQKQGGIFQYSDEALIELVKQGDHTAFEYLVRRYQALVYGYVKRRTSSHEQAEDVVQTVFLQQYLSLAHLRLYSPSQQRAITLRPWLLRVAANRCIDESRKRHSLHFWEIGGAEDEQEVSPEEDLVDTAPLAEELVEQRDLRAVLQRGIEKLPAKFRAIVLLRYEEGLTFREIGQRLQMPEGTVKSYFWRACLLLRMFLLEDSAFSR